MAAAAVLVGCSGNAAKDAFDDRQSLPSCGTFSVERREPPADAVRCLANAVGGSRGAELPVTRLTVEGDPYTTYYRAIPGRKDLEVFTDNTKDSYGTKEWNRSICRTLRSQPLSVGDCNDE